MEQGKSKISSLFVVVLLLFTVFCATYWLFSLITFNYKFYVACVLVSGINVIAMIARRFWKPSVIEEIGIGLGIIVGGLLLGFYDWAFFAFFCIYCWFIIRLLVWLMTLRDTRQVATCIPALVALLISGIIGCWMTGRVIGL